MIDNKQRLNDNCPKQEVDAQDSCSPCGSTDCEAASEASCDTCE